MLSVAELLRHEETSVIIFLFKVRVGSVDSNEGDAVEKRSYVGGAGAAVHRTWEDRRDVEILCELEDEEWSGWGYFDRVGVVVGLHW